MSQIAAPPPPPPAAEPTPNPLEAVSVLRQEMLKTMEDVSNIAQRRSINFLQSLGGGLLAVAFVFKLWPRWGASALSATEFITVIIVSMVLILSGAGIRLYQFKKEQEAAQRIRDSGVQLVSKAMNVATQLVQYQNQSKPPV